MAKFIFITGGVVSSLGKGITAASLGRLLKSRGLKVSILKLDPYINVDPGTMSPLQHGEVFVTDDGAETDLDLGHYERFIDENLTQASNVTAGRIYWSIITKERKGEFLGGTVQVIPHVTNEIKASIARAGQGVDIVMVEIGGTVGDIESLPFLEAIRQMKSDWGRDSALYMHVTLVPYVGAAQELKTKPTQHSVKELRSIGIQPDIIVCRSEHPIPQELRAKIALFCDIEPEAVIPNVDAESIYEVPLVLERDRLDEIVIDQLKLPAGAHDLTEWRDLVERMKGPTRTATIAIVGKYVSLPDAYLSVVEALNHGGIAAGARVDIRWVNSEELESRPVEQVLNGVDGVLVPGGFGGRGVEGKVNAIRFVREHHIPFLGICLGMQCAVIEHARDVCGLAGANSSEFDPDTPHPVIDLMPDQKDVEEMGGTMRLGRYPCRLAPGSLSRDAYEQDEVGERHRHRYEVNNAYRTLLERNGMQMSGLSPDERLVEIVELPGHPWFAGVQFHPELRSRPNRPHPLYKAFVCAAARHAQGRDAGDGRLQSLERSGSGRGTGRE